MKKLVIILLMATLILPASALEKEKTNKTGKETPIAITLTGSVVDQQTGEALPGAQVKINGSEQVLYTDLDGNFEVPKVKPGTYTLEITLVSYEENQIRDLVIKSDKNTAVKVELKR
ncbi:MAG: carboxypeptidase-like regulatory domain-containing protein [Bacteroidales bacterium]|jgi:hypothetical protein|nr:carboxypeptidase-like regulatory domain-containing protein [Bacteroidales bacterium]MDD3871934.1 carboxypeptidase-like regulatory domain-containing protein [Bacteroidales bacterium]MDD4813120.1 carboxypeptidase-like regulatory domain-containing protein [Bacteroidales bacterium]